MCIGCYYQPEQSDTIPLTNGSRHLQHTDRVAMLPLSLAYAMLSDMNTPILDPNDKRPVVLLDVDGVLNVFSRAIPRVWREQGVEKFNVHAVSAPDLDGVERIWTIKTIQPVIDWINKYDGAIQFIWLTSWRHRANDALAPEIGLKGRFPEGFDLAGVEPALTSQGVGQTYFGSKKAAVSVLTLGTPMPSMTDESTKGYLAGRKIAWIDDEINRNARDAFKNRVSPRILTMRTWESVGITPEMLQEMETYFGL